MKFVAFERSTQGTGASRRLRRAGRTPGIVYGGNQEPQLIELDHNNLWHAVRKEAFHSSVLTMELDGKKSQVLLRDLQMHPFKQLVLHADFLRVSATEKITVKVPLHFQGEEESNAVKLDKCVVNYIQNDLEVSCLPADLPESIVVDLSQAEKGDTITLADITLPENVEPVLRGLEAVDLVLVSVSTPAGGSTADGEEAEAGEEAKPEGEAEGEGEAS